jgi:hypothetical protein
MVKDASSQPLAYVYGDDRPQGAASHALTFDEARRIAANIARLPEFLSATSSCLPNSRRLETRPPGKPAGSD